MSRNASGTYGLVAGNPVVAGTTIEASWANTTMPDIATGITSSLDRSGRGGMLAALKGIDGSATNPAISWTSEGTSGLFLKSSTDVGVTVSGLEVAAFSATAFTAYDFVISAGSITNTTGAITFGNENLSGTGTLAFTGGGALTGTWSNLGSVTTIDINGGTIDNAAINSTPIGATTPAVVTGSIVTATTGFVGGLSGNITGNVTGNLTGNVTGNVVGAVTGNVTGDLSGNVTAASGTSTFNDVAINGGLDMNAGTTATITNLATPTNPNDAATKGYADGLAAGKLNLSGGTMSGDIVMDSNKITGLLDPTSAQDAATKIYVDNTIQGLDAKASCRAGTTANISLTGAQTIDGVAVVAGDRVLVQNQTSAAENGIYDASAGAWSRSSDANTWDELINAYTFVEVGTANANNGFVATIAAGGTLGVTDVTWVQFSGAGQIIAGTGLTKTGNTLDVDTASSSRIVVNANNIDLATTGVTADTYRSVTTDAYGRITGGTNPTTVSGYGLTDVFTKTEVTSSLALKLNAAGGTVTGAIAMSTNKITGLGDPTLAQDASTKAYTDSILGSATSAATSASQAATSASNALTSASNAATSEGNASTSASAAAGSATAAAASLDEFTDIYLGAKSTAPTVDNDGNALATGALYFNTVSNTMFVYSGSSWAAAGSAVNGTAERQEYTATSGQTTFAATYDVGFVDVYLNGSRLVPTTDFTATNGATVILTTGATTGDNVSIIAYGAFNVADVYTQAQSNARYTQIANNLSDLASAPTALTNLGLTATATELNYTDGVTSNIQTQLDAAGAGSVTSVGGTGTVSGLTLTGTVTSSGSLTLGGTLDDINLASGVTGTLPAANGGTGITAAGTSGNVLTSTGSGWASTAPAGGGAWEFFSSTTVSSSVANIEMALSSSHDQYMIVLDNISTGNDSGGYLRWKRGGSFITTDYYYVQGQGNWTSPQNQSSFKLRNANINQNCSGIFYLNAVNDTGAGKPNYYFNGPALYELLIVGGANQISTGAVTDIQMRWDHNVTSGSVYIYTLKTS